MHGESSGWMFQNKLCLHEINGIVIIVELGASYSAVAKVIHHFVQAGTWKFQKVPVDSKIQ